MNEITIVTAFFDINRKDMGNFSRTNEQYFKYFDDWARIQNNLVIFCEPRYKDKIMSIRSKYGLKDKTYIYEINNLIDVDIELYNSISNTMNNIYFKEYMYFNQNPEVINPLYNFLMCVKPLLVNMAIKKYSLKGTISWIDFGYNHGLKYYPYVDEFDFLWKYNFDKKFIHLFCIKDIPNMPVFEIVRRMNSYIQGGTLIADADKWSVFWNIIRENMIILNNVGLADDDQILYLMAYNRYPELFKLHSANWNEPMKLYGGKHLTYIKQTTNNTLKQKILSIYSKKIKIKRKIKYINRTFKILNYGELDA